MIIIHCVHLDAVQACRRTHSNHYDTELERTRNALKMYKLSTVHIISFYLLNFLKFDILQTVG